MNNKKKYCKIFLDLFGVEEADLNEAFTFEGVEMWDSFVHITLISELEEQFDVVFDTEDILHFGGFMNGIKILEKYGVDFSI